MDFESYCIENFDEIVSNNRPELFNLNWLICGRNKKRKSNGEYVVGEIKILNSFQQYLSIDEKKDTGYDLILIVDKIVFDNLSPDLKTKYITLLLNTVDYDEKLKIKKFSLLSMAEGIVSEEDISTNEQVQLIADQVYNVE